MSNPNHQSHQLTLQKINGNKAEADQNFHLLFNSVQMLNQQVQAMQNLFILTLDQLDIPSAKEIDYTSEEFTEKFGHIIGDYFIDKHDNTFYKMDLIVKGWDLTSHEDNTWKFTHAEKGEKIIQASTDHEAYEKLVNEIRNPLEVVTED